MSLLGDLAKNSCVIDFSIEELLPTVSVEHIMSEASQKSQTKSNHSSYSLIASSVVSPDRRNYLPVRIGFDDMSWGSQSRYFQKYRDKFSKIDGIVSLLSAKTRKIKYQFMVHLQRWCKEAQNQQLKHHKQSKKQKSFEMKTTQNKQNSLIFYSKLQQMVGILEGKEKDSKRQAFGRVHKKLRCWMKIDFLGKVIQECKNRVEKEEKRFFFMKFNSIAKSYEKIRKIPTTSKPISFPQPFKTSKVKLQLDSQPLPFLPQQNPSHPQKLMPLYPQQKQQQNIDYCDTMNLFMTHEQKGSQCSKGSASFGINSCVSAFDSKKSSTPKSYHKMLSEIQFTAVPKSALERRKVSDFISSVDQRIVSDYSHAQERKNYDNYMSPTKSETAFQNNNVFIKNKEEDEQTYKQHEQIYNFYIKKEQSHSRKLSSPEQVLRSRSQVKFFHHNTQRDSLPKEDIQSSYKEEMNRYLKFKKSLQERRNSTLKEIQKSQQTIKKLMIKYKNQKHKSTKLKNPLKLDKSKEGSIRGTSKVARDIRDVRDITSRKTSFSQKSRKEEKSKNSLKNDDKYLGNSLATKTKRQISPVLHQQYQNMDIYSHYIKQKKKMISEKSPPNKKSSKIKTPEQSSTKKPEKKIVPSLGHKNLLALSEFPIPKDHRIDVKVNLLKQQHKKMTHPLSKKQKVKNEIKDHDKIKIKPKHK